MTPIQKSIISCGLTKPLVRLHLDNPVDTTRLANFKDMYETYRNKAYSSLPTSTHCRVGEATILLRDRITFNEYPIFLLSDHNTELHDFIYAMENKRTRGTKSSFTGYSYGLNKSNATLVVHTGNEAYKLFKLGALYKDGITTMYHSFINRFLSTGATENQILDSLKKSIPFPYYNEIASFIQTYSMTIYGIDAVPEDIKDYYFPITDPVEQAVVESFIQKESKILDLIKQKTFVNKVTT